MPKSISGKDVRKQLKADLIGKDSYRGVTLTYTWLANQFGHFALGFVPTFILYTVLTKHCGHSIAAAAKWSPLIIWGCWIAFETYNFLGPLLLNSHSKSKVLFVAREKYTFQPAWGNIAFDTITDLAFFGFGSFAASLLCVSSEKYTVILLVIVLLLLYPSRYWYLTKMYLQIPEFPFQFRLSQWDLSVSDQGKDAVKKFLDPNNTKTHLLIFGSKNSGKTSLGVGLGTELAIKHNACVYTTAMKLYTMFFDPEQIQPESLWTWRSASVLIIDDVNPGDPIKEEIVTPATVKKFIDVLPENKTALGNMKVVWILGSPKTNTNQPDEWRRMLTDLGVSDIAEIQL